jgi:hypothetical protein
MFLEDHTCVLCNADVEETCFHLFFQCPFSIACWNLLSTTWNYNLDPLDMMLQARADFGSSIFREVVTTACWVIWKARSDIIFDRKSCSLQCWKATFNEELGLVCIKAKQKIRGTLTSWCENFV